MEWLGLVGAIAFLALVSFVGYRDRSARQSWTAWRQAQTSVLLDIHGGGGTGGWWASVPLVDVVLTSHELAFRGRWWWVPVRSTVVSPHDVVALKNRRGFGLGDYRRLEFTRATGPDFTLFLSPTLLPILGQAGWNTESN